MEVDVKDLAGAKVGTVELPADIFEAPINKDLMHQALVRQLAGLRLGTHNTRGRGEVSGGGKTHGQSDRGRSPGSNSSGTTPGRVYKGSRRPGHMGDVRSTSQNLKVVLVDTERNLIGVNGSVPGAKGAIVMLKEARKQ